MSSEPPTLFPRPLHPAPRSGGDTHGAAVTYRPLDQVPTGTLNFRLPEKCIKSPSDMLQWQNSKAYDLYMRFLVTLNNSVIGRGASSQLNRPASPFVEQLLDMLSTLDALIDETPPIEQPQRFGNMAFRTWHAKLTESADELIRKCLPLQLQSASLELAPYLNDSFGNATRIDYGTGHEAAFCMLLACLYLIGLLRKDDCATIVNRIFRRYIELVRRLQITYNMEPAGSHGVWSLDDFQFLPFIFGSAQLVDHPSIAPRHFVDEKIVEQNRDEYLFMNCIAHVQRVKTGPFAEHSNQLWNISALPTWSKINSGLLKMYRGEVLAKFPVVQHFLFGSILPFECK